jgi:glycerol-3-phosphate dehydrogenase
MERNFQDLTGSVFDLLIIGGGIYGTALAYEAAQHGLSVALVEKTDFCAATSANSLKIIHGGLRYLQHGDWRRSRRSIQERRTLLRIAPHLVRPLPILIPTSGYGLKGRPIMALGLLLNDLVGWDRNQGLGPGQALPGGYTVGAHAARSLLPGLPAANSTGAACFHDALVLNSERLPLAFLQTAVAQGAVAANYTEAVAWLRDGSRIVGVRVVDRLAGDTATIRAKMTINTTGPWVGNLWPAVGQTQPRLQWAKAFNVVVKRPLFPDYAAGLFGQASFEDSDTLLQRKGRFFFVVPWRDRAIIGTEYIPYQGDPAAFSVSEEEITVFLQEMNLVYPPANLTLDDVAYVQAGLVPITGVKNGSVQLAKHGQIFDHRQDGVTGCLTLMGVKYTTARAMAEEVVDRVFRQWDQTPPSQTAVTPLFGGDLTDVAAYVAQEAASQPAHLSQDQVAELVAHYGTQYRQLLPYLQKATNRENGRAGVSPAALLRAQAKYAVDQEMARRLADVVFRRTGLGSAGHPGQEAVRLCAEVMAESLGWSNSQMEMEITDVERKFAWHYAHDDGQRQLANTPI